MLASSVCIHSAKQIDCFFLCIRCFYSLSGRMLSVCPQDCSRGYYRDGRGQFIGACARCECGGYSEDCEDLTGVCMVSKCGLFEVSVWHGEGFVVVSVGVCLIRDIVC